MSGEEITDAEWKSLLEAARWAPSSYNAQPWCFIYAKRNTPSFQKFVDFLIDFNKGWAPKAAVLCVVASRTVTEKSHKPARTHAFDTGAAWENLALEACSRGLVAHGMEGFDYDRAKKELGLPEEYEVRAMFAIGKKAPIETLSPELQAREMPSDRKKIEEFAWEGKFRG
jgi:nitroreductase